MRFLVNIIFAVAPKAVHIVFVYTSHVENAMSVCEHFSSAHIFIGCRRAPRDRQRIKDPNAYVDLILGTAVISIFVLYAFYYKPVANCAMFEKPDVPRYGGESLQT